jgi:hypothetical protein
MPSRAAYEQADALMKGARPGSFSFGAVVVPALVAEWMARYRTAEPEAEVIRTETKGHSYLYDVPNTRLLAAWTIIVQREKRSRDESRMSGFPLPFGEAYHRGHAIAHTLGGGEEINLVPQLGASNIGPFRRLERKAMRHPGALYFTFWIYGGPSEQVPIRVEQGLLISGSGLELAVHENQQKKR